MATTTLTCSRCQFYDSRDGGLCRKALPTLIVVPTNNTLSEPGMAPVGVWPPVKADSWCGELQPKIETVN
jgi:hypothetical protein